MGTFCIKSVWDVPSQTLWIHPSFAFSFDHLVGAGEQRGRHFEAERPRRLKVDHQLELNRLHHRKVGGYYATENLADVDPALAVLLNNAGTIAHQAAGYRELAPIVNRRHRVARRQGDSFSRRLTKR